ncbi:MAG: TetR/AcrR family transcriptional regulator [Thermotogota bacterium]
MNKNKFIHLKGAFVVKIKDDNKRENLIQSARDMFLNHGFKDVSVFEITKKSNMATGSFYNYFSSKEELFLIIFNEENNKLKKSIMNQINEDEDPFEVTKKIFYKFLEGVQSNKILSEMFNQNTFRKIEKKTEFDFKENGEIAYSIFIPFIQKWQKKGIIKQKDPKYIIAFFDALLYVYINKMNIGKDFFPELLNDLIKFIFDGLKK